MYENNIINLVFTRMFDFLGFKPISLRALFHMFTWFSPSSHAKELNSYLLGGTKGWRKLKVWWVLRDAKIFHSYLSLREGNTKYPW
jgi:hypothetical protein